MSTNPDAAPTEPAIQPAFQVPPAGEPARVPNGNPIAGPGQQPGWVPQGQPAAQPGAQPAQPPAQPAASPDMANLVAMLQTALGNKAPDGAATPPAAPAATERPAWMQDSANTFDVSSIEDPILRSMATVMQTVGKGVDLDRVMANALAHGDARLIDVAYLQEKSPDNAQQLAEIARGIVEGVVAKSAAIEKSVHALAGGEAGWDAATAAFNAAAPQELRVTVAQMLNSTNEGLITAGAKIVAEFGKGSGMIPQAGAPLLNAAPGAAAGQGLSKASFQAELIKLRPDTPGYEEARTALFARRSLGKRSGL